MAERPAILDRIDIIYHILKESKRGFAEDGPERFAARVKRGSKGIQAPGAAAGEGWQNGHNCPRGRRNACRG